MILRHANDYDKKVAKQLYKEAFPFVERKPWFLINNWAKKGRFDLLVAIDEGGVQGFLVTTPYKDIVLFDYLAVSQNVRGKGVGSKILELAEKHYEGMRLMLVAEVEDEKAENNVQRQKRLKFYDNNGWTRTNNVCVATSGEMLVFTKKGDISADEFLKVNNYAMGNFLFKLCKMHVVPLEQLRK